jgi:hypothetical protein
MAEERPTYYDYIRGLESRMMSEYISSNAQLLYHTLLMICNKAHWEEWFPCTDYYLVNVMHMGVSAMKNARNDLKQLGMIDFVSSKKRGECTRYKVCNTFCTYQIEQQTTHQTTHQTYNKPNIKPHTNKDKDKDKEKDISPISPFTGKVDDIVKLWLAYKHERREDYKPTGLKAFYTKTENALKAYGESAVVDAINTAMANNWKGVYYDSKYDKKPDTPSVYQDKTDYQYDFIEERMRRKYDE